MRLNHQVPRLAVLAATLAIASSAWSQAGNCEAIRKQIEARIQASGATGWTLATVPADKPVPGKVVGQCDLGRQKIVYQASASAPAGSPPPILTECKDGSVSLGGDCPARR